MLQLQNHILEMVALGERLDVIARALCEGVEIILPGVVCSILTVDELGRMHPLAAPSLPPGFSAALDNLQVGPSVGSCGTAIALKTSVDARDIATDERWTRFKHLPLPLGLRRCWSTPIIGRDDSVYGAFALYFRTAHSRTEDEIEVIKASIHLCAIAIERDQQIATQHRLAYRDMLTGLPNRAAFNRESEGLATSGASPSGLLLIDLDNLKTINDTFGHRAGDRLLQAAAMRIEQSAAPHRTFRLGGDEFAVLIDGEGVTAEVLEVVARRLLSDLSPAVDCDGVLTVPRATIGGARTRQKRSLDELRQNADFALYHAKETRRGGFIAYSAKLGSTMTRRLRAIRDVSLALAEDRVDAHYQPVVRIDTGEIVGLEALFRVITPHGEIISAGEYFEATSDFHTAIRLTGRMLDIVAKDVRAWLDQGIWFQHVGINASSADFQGGRLHDAIADAFGREDVSLEHVILEVTETVYMGQAGNGIAKEIQNLRAKGLRVALDDFGTGFASLTHLLSEPVDVIKIDKSFIARMEKGSRSAAIVEGLLDIAAKLDIRVIAEGIETQVQADQLHEFGCTLGQGYLYSRPVDRKAVTQLLFDRAQKRDPDLKPAREPSILPDVAAEDAARPQPEQVVRYAVLLCGDDWRVVSERRQFGRFTTRSAAFQCAIRLAREANASGAVVELLHTDTASELRAFRLANANLIPLPGDTLPGGDVVAPDRPSPDVMHGL